MQNLKDGAIRSEIEKLQHQMAVQQQPDNGSSKGKEEVASKLATAESIIAEIKESQNEAKRDFDRTCDDLDQMLNDTDQGVNDLIKGTREARQQLKKENEDLAFIVAHIIENDESVSGESSNPFVEDNSDKKEETENASDVEDASKDKEEVAEKKAAEAYKPYKPSNVSYSSNEYIQS